MIAHLDKIAPGGAVGTGGSGGTAGAGESAGPADAAMRSGMQSVHKAAGLERTGDTNGMRDQILNARAHFTQAKNLAPVGAQGKIATAIGLLDGLSGGMTDATKDIPKADSLLPALPDYLQEGLISLLYNTIQYLNPASGISGNSRNVSEWLNANDLHTSQEVQHFLRNAIIKQGQQK